jgi:predicted nucleotidyltransferase
MAKGTASSVSDVDLLVIGDLDETALHVALMQAQEQLRRSVNYTLLGQSEFLRRRREKKGFLARVLAGPKITIVGSTDEI